MRWITLTRSRYFAVTMEKTSPSPNPKPAITIREKDRHNIQRRGSSVILDESIASRRKKNMENCIPNRIKLTSTTESGMINLGKYTLPKRVPFWINVNAVPVKHSEKSVHKMIPDR